MEELTKRQKKVFDYLRKEVQEKGFPPSIREIGKAIGIVSLRGVTGVADARLPRVARGTVTYQ